MMIIRVLVYELSEILNVLFFSKFGLILQPQILLAFSF